MVEETMQAIKKAEEEAASIVQEAKEEASRRREEARNEAKSRLQKAEDAARVRSETDFGKVQKEKELSAPDAEREWQTEIEKIKALAANKEKQIIDLVIDAIGK